LRNRSVSIRTLTSRNTSRNFLEQRKSFRANFRSWKLSPLVKIIKYRLIHPRSSRTWSNHIIDWEKKKRSRGKIGQTTSTVQRRSDFRIDKTVGWADQVIKGKILSWVQFVPEREVENLAINLWILGTRKICFADAKWVH